MYIKIIDASQITSIKWVNKKIDTKWDKIDIDDSMN